MWMKFSRDFDFEPAAHGGRLTLAYKAGAVENVTRECAKKAKEAGAAMSINPPKRDEHDEALRRG